MQRVKNVEHVELLDPEHNSIDYVCAQFENYKTSCQEKNSLDPLSDCTEMKNELKKLNSSLNSLQQGVQQLQKSNSDWQQAQIKGINAIMQAQAHDVGDGTVAHKDKDKIVIIRTGAARCVFENCNLLVDSQLLLLHYLCDHSDELHGLKQCHDIYEGDSVVLSFHPKTCHFRQNKVLGLLTYGGTIEQKIFQVQNKVIFNTFLPATHAHLKSHIPVVVLICKTAASAVLTDKLLARKVQARANHNDQVYVIWLVTPYDRLHLNATLCLCGRDAAAKACTIVAVRQVKHSQNTSKFMPVDANYWRLSFQEIYKITNGFRDELHLEIRLTGLRTKAFN